MIDGHLSMATNPASVKILVFNPLRNARASRHDLVANFNIRMCWIVSLFETHPHHKIFNISRCIVQVSREWFNLLTDDIFPIIENCQTVMESIPKGLDIFLSCFIAK